MKKNTTQLRTRTQNGFSTIELLIAFSVGIIFLTAAIMVAYTDPTMNHQVSLDSNQATVLDVSLDNNALAISGNKIGDAVADLIGNWNAVIGDTAADPNDPTHLALDTYVEDTSQCTKTITNTTSWTTLGSRDRNISFGTALSDINTAIALGRGACDPFPADEWDNPQNPGWQTTPSAIDGTQSGVAAATINGTPYAFIVTTHTSQKKDLWVINVSNTSSPTVINSLETGGDSAHKDGLNDIAVVTTSAGTYAYVLQNSVDNQLQTINLSNPTGTLSVANTVSFVPYGVTTAGTNPQGKVITYYNGRLYIGLYNTVGPEILVFDIKNTPAAPQYVGSTNLGHSINDIVIKGNYAYLAIKPGNPPTGRSTKELQIVNISGNTPALTSFGYNASTTLNDTEAATTLYQIGNKLYMGREKVSDANEKDFYVFDISTPTNPSVIKSKKMSTIGNGGSMGTPRIIDLVVQGKMGFFVTTDSAKPFQVFDVVSNSSDIIPVSNCNNYVNLPKLTEIIYTNGYIYGANGNQAALNILRNNPNACTL